MSHFVHFPVTAPHPGTCLRCGNNSDIYLLGVTSFSDNILYCSRCVRELAIFTGFTDAATATETMSAMAAKISDLEAELARIPNLTEGLINAIRSNITDFVFAVSDSPSVDDSLHLEPAESADSGEHEAERAGSEHSNTSRKPSSK